MNIPNILKLILSLAFPLVCGAVAGYLTAESIPGWYSTLNRPLINPPNWLFGPVWTCLYILMGISLYMIWKLEPSRQRNLALLAFAIQMLLNFTWSILFFHFKEIGIALIEIVILLISILVMTLRFYKLNPRAAYINIPYILWVSFATALNAAYFSLN